MAQCNKENPGNTSVGRASLFSDIISSFMLQIESNFKGNTIIDDHNKTSVTKSKQIV